MWLNSGIKSPKPNFDQNKTIQSKPVFKSPTSISSTTGSAGKPPIRCFNCRQVGHRASECNVNIPGNPKSSYPAGKRTGGEATGSPTGKANINHAKVIVDKVEGRSRAAIIMHGSHPVLEILPLIILSRSYYDNLDTEMFGNGGDDVKSSDEVSIKVPAVLNGDETTSTDSAVDTVSVLSDKGGVADQVFTLPCEHVAGAGDTYHTCPSAMQTNSVRRTGTSITSDIDPVTYTVPLAQLEYCNIAIQSVSKTLHGMKHSGAQVNMIQEDLIKGLDVPVLGTIEIHGVMGKPKLARLVSLSIKPSPVEGYENIAPYFKSISAAGKLSPDTEIILTTSTVKQLEKLEAYNVLKCTVVNSVPLTVDARELQKQSADVNAVPKELASHRSVNADDVQVVTMSHEPVNVSAHEAFRTEQQSDLLIKKLWPIQEQQQRKFFIKDGLLMHSDQVLHEEVKQLCLPETRVKEVCAMAHKFAHTGGKCTLKKIRLNFWWPHMAKKVKDFVKRCDTCQKRRRLVTRDRIPISVIQRDLI